MLGRRNHLIQNTVNPVTHLKFILKRLKVNVRGLILNGLQKNQIQQPFDRIRVRGLLQLIQIDTRIPPLKIRQPLVALNFPNQFGQTLLFLGVILVHRRIKSIRVGHLRFHRKAHQSTQVICGTKIIRIIKHHREMIPLRIVGNRKNAVGFGHLGRHLTDNLLRNFKIIYLNIFHPPLTGQSNRKVFLLHKPHLKKDLAYLDFPSSFFLDAKGLVDLFTSYKAHFYQNAA